MTDKPFDPARPRYTLPLAGKDYDLLGTMEVIESVEHAMQRGVLHVTTDVVGMGMTDTSKLLSAVLSACGHKMTQKEAGAILFNQIGINSTDFQMVQLHLYAFLRVAIEPPEAREEAAKRMGELIGGRTGSTSPGDSTKRSA